MIHVCFSLHDKNGTYSKFTGTTMFSLFENTSAPVTVHILHDDTLTQDNRDKFIYLAGRCAQAVKFYNVEKICPEKLSEMLRLIPFAKTSRLSVAALYRLLISQVLSSDIDKIIYLDSDIVVNLDIKELWQLELGEKILAAAPEAVINYLDHPFHSKTKFLIVNDFVASEDYFNSGVLLMNLERVRNAEELIMEGVKFCGRYPQCDTLDQDILNYLFSKNYLKLPERFDVYPNIDRRRGYKLIRKVIYHYGGWVLSLDMNDPFNRLWMDYFLKTPWFDSDSIGRLYESFLQGQAELKNFAVNISAAMSGKTRAFITFESLLDTLLKNFSVREDEDLFVVEEGITVQKILEAINASRGEKIFFLLLPNFPFNVLQEAGLVYGRDFADGFYFLSSAQGVPFNSHQILKAM